eukprot:17247-Chlamydomonas_euryale.AAC.2
MGRRCAAACCRWLLEREAHGGALCIATGSAWAYAAWRGMAARDAWRMGCGIAHGAWRMGCGMAHGAWRMGCGMAHG